MSALFDLIERTFELLRPRPDSNRYTESVCMRLKYRSLKYSVYGDT